MKTAIQTRKKCIFTKSTINNNTNNRNIIREDSIETTNFN